MTPTRAEVSAAVDPLGWRLILGAVYTQIPVSSVRAGAEAALVAASIADGDGHLSVDIRTDRVILRLHTATAGRVTDTDLILAERITEALTDSGLRNEPGDVTALEIAIDAIDIPAVRPFWAAVTGYVGEPAAPELGDTALIDPAGRGPTIWFQQMDSPRPQRNRIHLDIDVAPEQADGRIAAAVAAGGVLISDAAAPAFWVLADVEGNEACICTWQGRD